MARARSDNLSGGRKSAAAVVHSPLRVVFVSEDCQTAYSCSVGAARIAGSEESINDNLSIYRRPPDGVRLHACMRPSRAAIGERPHDERES